MLFGDCKVFQLRCLSSCFFDIKVNINHDCWKAMIILPGRLIVGPWAASLQIIFSNKHDVSLYVNFKKRTIMLMVHK